METRESRSKRKPQGKLESSKKPKDINVKGVSTPQNSPGPIESKSGVTNSDDVNTAGVTRDEERTRKIWMWIVLGVAASCLPVCLCLIHDSVVGFNTPSLKITYFKDLALVIAAVGANALNCALSANGKIRSCFFTGFSAVLGFGLYCLFRPDEGVDNFALNVLIGVCIVLLIINATVGYRIESESPSCVNDNTKGG